MADRIAELRNVLGIAPDTSYRRVRVSRLAPAAGDYDLVEFGDPGAVVGVGILSADEGEVLGAAGLPGTGPHLALDASAARVACGAAADAPARLVWEPSQATRSSLYPVWEVAVEQGVLYVDQAGNVWRDLGGGPLGG